MKGAPEQRRQVMTREVDVRWVYNNFHVGVLIVDTRTRDLVMVNTPIGAIHIPPQTESTIQTMDAIEQRLDDSHRMIFSKPKRFLREVVLIGDDPAGWMQCLQTLLVDEGVVASVSILVDSFDAFAQRYPFYTEAHCVAPSTAGPRVTYPNEIEDRFLYLGNLWQAESKQVIRDLGITHVVNATLDLDNVFEGHGVRYHVVKIPDHADADISSYFDSTFAFIEHARSLQSPHKHHRVLVHCTQGISRSATLVIMYLMRAHRWSLVTAFNHTHRSRPVIIPNKGFFRALMENEQRLFDGRSSLDETEIDALLQGRVGDHEPTSRPRTCTNEVRSRRHVLHATSHASDRCLTM